MTTVNPPRHGEKTHRGMWWDDTARAAIIEDPRQGLHLPCCDVIGCDFDTVDQLTAAAPQELTYDASEGLWLCPTHWAESESVA